VFLVESLRITNSLFYTSVYTGVITLVCTYFFYIWMIIC